MAPKGHAFSHIPHPLQWSISKSSRLPSFTGMHPSGQTGAHRRHCLHLSLSNTGACVLHSPVLKSFDVPPAKIMSPSVRSSHGDCSLMFFISVLIYVPLCSFPGIGISGQLSRKRIKRLRKSLHVSVDDFGFFRKLMLVRCAHLFYELFFIHYV